MKKNSDIDAETSREEAPAEESVKLEDSNTSGKIRIICMGEVIGPPGPFWVLWPNSFMREGILDTQGCHSGC